MSRLLELFKCSERPMWGLLVHWFLIQPITTKERGNTYSHSEHARRTIEVYWWSSICHAWRRINSPWGRRAYSALRIPLLASRLAQDLPARV